MNIIHSGTPRGKYTGPIEHANNVKAGARAGKTLGYLGLILTAVDMSINGVNTSNSLDATFGVISFAGVPGAIVGGGYFAGNLATIGTTGKDVGQQIDNNFIFISTNSSF